jgi:hypothetical protein
VSDVRFSGFLGLHNHDEEEEEEENIYRRNGNCGKF